MRLQTQIAQAGVVCVVVVLLALDARVGQTIDLDLQAQRGPSRLDGFGQLQDAELLGELVEDAILTGAPSGGVA
jgi:hypothetical protein